MWTVDIRVENHVEDFGDTVYPQFWRVFHDDKPSDLHRLY